MNRPGTDVTEAGPPSGDNDPMGHPPWWHRSGDALVSRGDSLPGVDRLGGRWQKEVQDAGRVWQLLTPDDLSRIESRERTLAEMLRRRYALSRAEVDKLILGFIQDHQTCAL